MNSLINLTDKHTYKLKFRLFTQVFKIQNTGLELALKYNQLALELLYIIQAAHTIKSRTRTNLNHTASST